MVDWLKGGKFRRDPLKVLIWVGAEAEQYTGYE